MLYVNKRIEIDQQTMVHGPNSATACLSIKFYWKSVTPIRVCFCFLYSYTHTTVAVLSVCERDCMSRESQKYLLFGLLQKSLLTHPPDDLQYTFSPEIHETKKIAKLQIASWSFSKVKYHVGYLNLMSEMSQI